MRSLGNLKIPCQHGGKLWNKGLGWSCHDLHHCIKFGTNPLVKSTRPSLVCKGGHLHPLTELKHEHRVTLPFWRTFPWNKVCGHTHIYHETGKWRHKVQINKYQRLLDHVSWKQSPFLVKTNCKHDRTTAYEFTLASKDKSAITATNCNPLGRLWNEQFPWNRLSSLSANQNANLQTCKGQQQRFICTDLQFSDNRIGWPADIWQRVKSHSLVCKQRPGPWVCWFFLKHSATPSPQRTGIEIIYYSDLHRKEGSEGSPITATTQTHEQYIETTQEFWWAGNAFE